MKAEQSTIRGWSEGMFGTFVLEKKKIKLVQRNESPTACQALAAVILFIWITFFPLHSHCHKQGRKKRIEVAPNSSRVCDLAVRSVRPRMDQMSRRELRLSDEL